MAAELVAGAFLSSFLDVVIERLLSSEVANLIRGKRLDQRLLQRLETSLNVVQAVLNDAEQKQITDPAVKKWLTNLEDAVYVADDLLDEVQTKAAAQKHPGNFWSRCFKFNLQARKMVAKIEEVILTLEKSAEHKGIVLRENIAMGNMSERIPSTSLVEESDIYGRDADKNAIINKLKLDDTSDAKISVMPIVGMGGVGKTTLAQLVYNADELKGKFDFKAWVCVGKNFDALKMTKTILEAKNSNFRNINDLNLIQLELEKVLTGKRFLVVLDDMWDVNYVAWEEFRIPFRNGLKGSKIIVTTRNESDASVVQTIHPYNLSELSKEHCWLVFAKHASPSRESPYYSSLVEVGEKIVEKCKGLPLAAKTLGGLLRTKHNVKDWNKILESEIWGFSETESSILPALRISYHYLPSHLKRCFVFCSLYPKGHQFDRDELVLLWMAEDLLQPKSRTLEEFGSDCFNDLASRSFFQPSKRKENLFVLHDLMHDLATFYAGKFYFRAAELETTTNVDLKARHLSYDVPKSNLASKFLETVNSLKHARTLLQTSFDMFEEFPQEFASSIPLLLSQMKCLRVLCFKGIPLDSMPKSIGELIHLRYFDLSRALIETLPESLSKLYNLQTLKLRDCKRLKMLPSRMQDLVNLRHLDIRGTCLKEIPKGMNKLKDLRFVSDYIVGHNVNRIREFGELTNLHGSLVIHKLENVSNSGEASDARMSDKEHIDDLEFIWSSSCDNVDLQTEKDIFEKLKPCTVVKEIKISGYRGEVFPDWLGQSSYHRMTVLRLSGCRNCCELPSLGQLPHLKHLEISFFDKLTSIGAEFYKNDHETPFPSLETLELSKLSSWQVWHSSQFGAAFPKLKKLSISNCPMLRGDLPHLLPVLEELDTFECEQLDCSLPSAPNIHHLRICGFSEVRFQELPLSLWSESISGNKHVEFLSEAMTHMQLTSLGSLSISNCSSATSFPELTSLGSLSISRCSSTISFPGLTSLGSLSISNCSSAISFPELTSLESLSISRCSSTISFAGLTSLGSLSISDCSSAISFPGLTSLGSLSISNCSSAISFPGLTSLGSLSISRCSSAISFRGLTSLGSLSISNCSSAISFPGVKSLRSLSISRWSSAISFAGVCMPASLQHLEIRD